MLQVHDLISDLIQGRRHRACASIASSKPPEQKLPSFLTAPLPEPPSVFLPQGNDGDGVKNKEPHDEPGREAEHAERYFDPD